MHSSNPFQSFLSCCLAGDKLSLGITVKGCQAESLAPGILRFTPYSIAQKQPALVLSAGIHGNETAPIELLDHLISDMMEGKLPITRPVLMIFGNLNAMKVQTRFIETNLNRLFTRDNLTTIDTKHYEPSRAREIMQAVDEFRSLNGDLWHYDLHTAIRDSAIEKFALYPFVKNRDLPAQQKEILVAAGVNAIVLQNKVSTTFSSYSSSQLHAESFTLELGRVKPFGENDLTRLHALDMTLRQIISGNDIAPSPSSIQVFEVCHEILNTGESFQLHIPENAANFTAYEKGEMIWEDNNTEYKVESEPEYILFPNSQVKKGERAGLLVKPCANKPNQTY